MPRRLAFVALLVVLGGCVGAPQGTPVQVLVGDEVAAEALSWALSVQGAQYAWGGQGPDEFDCSGLIIWAYAQVISDLKLRIGSQVVNDATQDELWKYNVEPIPPEQMRPGDIVFITSDRARMTHGGLFIEWVDQEMSEFRFVNASSFHGEVVVDAWPVSSEVRGQWFAGAGRLLVTVN